MSGEQKHPYHLVEPSPWPVLGSLGAFVLVTGGVLYMHEHDYGIATMGAGLALVLATMFFWWRDVIREAEYQGASHPDCSDRDALRDDAVHLIRGDVLCCFLLGIL